MAKRLNSLIRSDPAKTTVFFSPFQSNSSKHALVRTGSPRNTNSFIHSLLMSSNKDYQAMNDTRRNEYVEKICTKFATEKTEPNMPRFDLPKFAVITEMLTSVDFETLNKCSEKYLSDTEKCKNALKHTLMQIVSQKEELNSLSDEGLRKLKLTIYKFVDRAVETTVTVRSTFDEKDPDTLNELADYIDRDIYILDGHSRVKLTTSTVRGRKSVICLKLDEKTYEPVGRISRHQGNIERDFSRSDPLIRRMSMYVSEPELIAREHPDLIEYLPKNMIPRTWSDGDDEQYPDSLNLASVNQ